MLLEVMYIVGRGGHIALAHVRRSAGQAAVVQVCVIAGDRHVLPWFGIHRKLRSLEVKPNGGFPETNN